MTSIPKDERYQAYGEAIRRRVCSVCLDCADDGTCGLPGGRNCAIEVHLAKLVATLMAVKSGRMDEYVAAVQSDICTTCSEQDAEGVCRLRQKGDCALTVYMPMVLKAIEEVDAAWRDASRG